MDANDGIARGPGVHQTQTCGCSSISAGKQAEGETIMKRVFFRIPHVALLLALLVGVNLVSGCGGSSVLTIAFTTSSQVLDANLSSRVMTIQVQGGKGKPSNLKADTTINLTSSSSAGRFDTSQSGLFSGDITSVTIPKGSASASFYYRDATAGSPTITATELPSQGWHQGSQQQKVNPALTISTASLPDGDAGTNYSQTLGSGGGTGTYTWSVSSGTLPTGLTLAGNTISGMPTTAGLSNPTFSVTDGIDTATRVLSIKINPTLVVSSSSIPSGDPGISYSQTLAASGGSGSYTWSITGGTLPAGLSLDRATGVVSGTPSAPGTSSFTVNVNDGIGTASKPMSTTINAQLTIVTALLPNGTQSNSYSQTLAAAGGSGIYTWSITGGALPTGLSLTGNTISGTATANGEFSFTIQVTDGIGSVARGVSITIIRIRT